MQTTGCCRFCGQIKQIEFLEDVIVTDEMADEQAMLTCGCSNAQHEQTRRKKIVNAQEDIRDLFGENGENETTQQIAEVLNAALVHLVDCKLSKVSVERGKIKAKISQTSKGGIKVERTVTQKDALES